MDEKGLRLLATYIADIQIQLRIMRNFIVLRGGVLSEELDKVLDKRHDDPEFRKLQDEILRTLQSSDLQAH